MPRSILQRGAVRSFRLWRQDGPSLYFFTCLWYSCRLQTSNLPKSCLSMRPSTVEVRAAMVVVIGMPDTTAFERIWICTLCVQSPCSSNENMQAYSRFSRCVDIRRPWLRRRFVRFAYNRLVRQMKTQAFSLDSLRCFRFRRKRDVHVRENTARRALRRNACISA